jgi:hypothetical protein
MENNMEVLPGTQDQTNNQASPAEGAQEGAGQEGGAELAPPAQQPAAEGPSKLDQLKAKSKEGVAHPLVPAQEQAAAVAAYKANIKFKAAGKEHEVPEFLRGVMKDEQTEKYLHSLLSKAHGLEMVQDKLKSTRQDREQAVQAYQSVMQPIQYAKEAYQRGDLDTVFDTLKIDANKVLQWAYQKVQLSQMPPEQRQLHEARTAAERRAYELERNQRFSEEAQMEAQAEQLNNMLELVLERQDISSAAQEYDSRKGKQGAFRDLVVQIGEQEFFRTNKVISPLQAAQQAIDLLGMKAGAQAAKTAAPPQQPAAPAVAAAAETSAQPKKITLPNAGGSKTAAPAKAKIRSLEDLHRAREALNNS